MTLITVYSIPTKEARKKVDLCLRGTTCVFVLMAQKEPEISLSEPYYFSLDSALLPRIPVIFPVWWWIQTSGTSSPTRTTSKWVWNG
jgi:hypothetical protein